jgi:hypothetical protein
MNKIQYVSDLALQTDVWIYRMVLRNPLFHWDQ